jgi:glycerophosphoryl diester phosphodiesterase
MKQKFYIIGHNPNSVGAAIRCLKNGANAIEPDIRYLPVYDEKFFVYDLATENPKNHTLKDYLTGLSAALNREKLNLALIAFDLKPIYSKEMESDTLVYMKEFFDQLNEYFFNTYTSVPVLLTVGDPSGKPLLATAKPYLKYNQAVGVDEGDMPHCVAEYFEKEQMPCAYANGTSSPFASPGKFKQLIKEAVALKRQTNELKLVYTWTANSLKTMRDFVNVGVDGMITDRVTRLRTLIDTKYKSSIELATANDNPFA